MSNGSDAKHEGGIAGFAPAFAGDKPPVHVITADVELEENYAEKGFDSIVLKSVTIATVGPILAGIVEKKG